MASVAEGNVKQQKKYVSGTIYTSKYVCFYRSITVINNAKRYRIKSRSGSFLGHVFVSFLSGSFLRFPFSSEIRFWYSCISCIYLSECRSPRWSSGYLRMLLVGLVPEFESHRGEIWGLF